MAMPLAVMDACRAVGSECIKDAAARRLDEEVAEELDEDSPVETSIISSI